MHEEARGFYNNYSRIKGFATRQGKKVRNIVGEIVRYTFVCNREGFREKKWLEKTDRKREHKVVTQCGCVAEMRIKRKDGSGKWYVSRFIDEHSHELLLGKFVDFLRSHRKISEVEIAHLTIMRDIGIIIPKIYESFAAQLGGFNMDRDVNAAIRFLEGVGRVDGKMFWRHRLGLEQHLCDLFWSDGRSQYDYGVFGDVLAFDATYGRNKYNRLVVVFYGVNHHNQTCVFATTLVSCESHESYVWVLDQFLEYIETNEFEVMWEIMLDECGMREVEWVQELYRKKYSLSTTYIRGRFFAGIRTTSRCESLHAKLGRFVESRTPVLQTQFIDLEKSGATRFTWEMFWRYHESLK
ncbi:protein FAR1-RELATED SEQUENCE 6-like [Arachis stenosperma]|uniref:protein FAR1-RELATED SEQUENCE 6-like n=1 Tax=Arachis stenosperma TaxID=217475 RepID=UPI0025ABFD60|nr:protein FAR1-RELATED SEQUENCE 6-like [Arachis stenosperma]